MTLFDKHYKRYDAWYEKNKLAYLSEIKAIKKVLPKKGKGLEIGVGTGRFASSLGIRFGIDPSQNMLKIAAKRDIDTRKAQGERIPYGSSFFDYVAIIITICFVKDPSRVLRESKRVLKKGGRIIIGIIDKESFLGKFYQKKESIFYKKAKFLSVKNVNTLLRNSGFSDFRYYQTIFSLPGDMRSVQKPQKGFGKGSFVVISAKKP